MPDDNPIAFPEIRKRVRAVGREVFRINGVFMYVVNEQGDVGAVLGFHPLVLVMLEDATDEDPLRAYLRLDRWLYPLARAFSPIYIWNHDCLIMPEPYSSFKKPAYIVVRIPFSTSEYQKATLFNLLDVVAHVRGSFSTLPLDQVKALDKQFTLTQLTKADEIAIDFHADGSGCFKTSKDLPTWNRLDHIHDLLTCPREVKLSVGIDKESSVYVKSVSKKAEHSRSSLTPSALRGSVDSSAKWTRLSDEPILGPGNGQGAVDLPRIRGNIMRLYILGPRDPQHIKIINVHEWFPVNQIVMSGVDYVFDQQVRLMVEKEAAGCVPTLEGREARWMHEWACSKHTTLFTVSGSAKPETNLSGGTAWRLKDLTYRGLVQQATTMQNLEAAAQLFDLFLDKCQLELVNYSTAVEDHVDYYSDDKWLDPLIPTDLVSQYRRSVTKFAQLNIIGRTVESDLVYPKLTNYIERAHEDCEHHYPKLRPRNVLLDPKYNYPRKPPAYKFTV